MTLFNFYCIQQWHSQLPLFIFEYCPVGMVKQNLLILEAARTPAILKGQEKMDPIGWFYCGVEGDFNGG